MDESKYVYPYSYDKTQRSGEMEKSLCRESQKANCECKHAIETAITENFDGSHLNHDVAKGVIAEFGYDRVNFVLANTLKQLAHDGRFSQDNKAWAREFDIPTDKVNGHDYRNDFIVNSHPAVLDGFIGLARKEYQALGLWEHTHCNRAAELDFTGKVMVLDPTILTEMHKNADEQLFLCSGGFGCNPQGSGGKVYGQFLVDSERAQYYRNEFIGELKAEFLPDWAVEKLAALKPPEQEQTNSPAMGGMTMQ